MIGFNSGSGLAGDTTMHIFTFFRPNNDDHLEEKMYSGGCRQSNK
jgi:hypothetical protein